RTVRRRRRPVSPHRRGSTRSSPGPTGAPGPAGTAARARRRRRGRRPARAASFAGRPGHRRSGHGPAVLAVAPRATRAAVVLTVPTRAADHGTSVRPPPSAVNNVRHHGAPYL